MLVGVTKCWACWTLSLQQSLKSEEKERILLELVKDGKLFIGIISNKNETFWGHVYSSKQKESAKEQQLPHNISQGTTVTS